VLTRKPKKAKHSNAEGVYFAYMGRKKTQNGLNPIFWSVDFRDVITPFEFGDDRLSSLGLAEGQIHPFPLTLMVALTTLSHYCASM